MTYPPGNPPGSPGFQPAQPPGSGPVPTPSFVKTEDGTSKLPVYLQIAVIFLGLAVYLLNFGPILVPAEGDFGAGVNGDAGEVVPLALLAALLVGVGLLPKMKNYTAIVAVIAVIGALLAIRLAFKSTQGEYLTAGWALWAVLALAVLQAGAAVFALLLEAGVVTAPAPRPKFDPYSAYGAPGGYFGQPGQLPPGQPGAQPGYPSYNYPPTPGSFGGPPSGGFGVPSAPAHPGTGPQPAQPAPSGPPTPPTGFPSFPPPPPAAPGGADETRIAPSDPPGPAQP